MKKIIILMLMFLLIGCNTKPTQKDKLPEEYLGDYVDSIAGRGQLSLNEADNDQYSVSISWSSSAFEKASYEFLCDYNATENKLSYKDGILNLITFTSETESDIKEVYNDGTGYFLIEDNNLVWTSDKENDNTGTVFTKGEGNCEIANPWCETLDLQEAIDMSGVELVPPIEEVLKADFGLNLWKYRYMPGVIEILYESVNDELRIRKSHEVKGKDLAGDYNEYPENWKESIKGLEVDCYGQDGKINLALFNYDNNYFSLNYNSGYPGEGITIENVQTIIMAMQ